MTTEATETTSTTIYGLECKDCAFEATVEGSFYEALDVAESHQEQYGKAPMDHFVNFERDGAK